MKKCTKCQQEKSVKDFVMKKKKPRSVCKACHAAYQREYNKKCDPELKKARNLRSQEQQKTRRKEICSGERPIEEQIDYWAKKMLHRSNRKELSLEVVKKLALQAKQKFPYLKFGYLRSRSKNCGYSASIDRINPELGYTNDNIQIIPLWLNSAKLTLSEQELRKLMNHYLKNY